MSHNRDHNSIPDGFRVLNTSELRELLKDEEKMDQIVRLSEKFQELQVDRETLLTSNHDLAEESLARRPRLQTGKLRLAEKYQQLESLAAGCREKQNRLEACTEKRSPQSAQNLLQEEVARAEEESEDLLERFMEGAVPLDAFLESFQNSRRVYHIRRAQAEKIQEFSRPGRSLGKLRRPEEEEEQRKKKAEQQEPRPNGFIAQGPARVFQLRYGLTPAIILPHYPYPPASGPAPGHGHAPTPAHAGSLPPPDPQPGHGPAHGRGPSAPPAGPGQPVGLRVIGQLPGWPARPVRLQQLYRPSYQQPEPPFR